MNCRLNTLLIVNAIDVTRLFSCSKLPLKCRSKKDKSQCCHEIDRCREVMEQFGDRNNCITLHPGFQDVCLNRRVLEVAGLSPKTKSGKSYRTLFIQGRRAEAE